MKYTIYEFDINETLVDNSESRQSNLQLAESFPVELREKLLSILSERGKSMISYSISKNGEFVGEITLQNENPRQPEIGIELEKPFQRQGIGYRLTSALMERYKKEHQVDYFVYTAAYGTYFNFSTVNIIADTTVETVSTYSYSKITAYSLTNSSGTAITSGSETTSLYSGTLQTVHIR